MSKVITVPDHVHEQAKKEAEERNERMGAVVTEWMLVARYEERERE